jgi:predicted nucleic acid-binding protein
MFRPLRRKPGYGEKRCPLDDYPALRHNHNQICPRTKEASMLTPKIYLETSIFNYYFDTEREAHPYTLKLFEEIKSDKYEAYTSEYVTDELLQAPDEKKHKMFKLIEDYRIILIKASPDVRRLADIYVQEKIIPVKYITDALHIAVTSVRNLDFIVSLNFRHIVKRKTILMTKVVNVREGYKEVGIFSPMEVVEHEEDA